MDDKQRFIWADGELLPWAEATTHVLTHALHYGSGVFEGIRSYDTPSGPAGFRLRDHFERLHRSAAAYAMPLEWSVDELCIATKEVICANELTSCYIRPIAFYGSRTLGLDCSQATLRTVIAAWQWGAYLGDDGVRNGIRAKVSSWRRFPASSFPNAKATGTYANSILAKMEAVRSGYEEAIMMNGDGLVSEATGENIFIVRDGIVLTPPLSAGCLNGITRDTIMNLLRDAGYQVAERDLDGDDLGEAEEVMLTGTAAEVTPVREIDGRPVGEGRPGPVTLLAQRLFAATTTGRLEPYRHWLEFI
jgi:branched-chain amino acid aminotransferase